MARRRCRSSVYGIFHREYGEALARIIPQIEKRIRRSFGLDREKKTETSYDKCPGETDCSDFKKAAGKTAAEKEKEACASCPKFPTKPKSDEKTADEFTDLIAYVYRQRGRRQSGLDFERMTWLETEMMIALDMFTEQAQREADFLMRNNLEDHLEFQQQILKIMLRR